LAGGWDMVMELDSLLGMALDSLLDMVTELA